MELEAKRLPGGDGIMELEAQHRHYSEQLDALIQKPYLSEEEQLEEVRLKKLKLRVKDEMAARRHGLPQSYAV
ncbi:MAG: YdcH family protein [Silvibacterium sp.]